ncbi:hypothetical protein ABZ858_30060 [Streptomyces sp. NPDC047017]|uniref:hypothetical protein n=1 Tax=Streptomyces sp. NPDC047017 TaxID=3155024 RepID=UPI00340E8777
MAFTQAERNELSLTGRLPSGVLTLEQQARRAYQQLQARGSDLAKDVYLEQLHDRNEVLYYRLLTEHLVELLPVVYDPTAGEAIESTPTSTAAREGASCPSTGPTRWRKRSPRSGSGPMTRT